MSEFCDQLWNFAPELYHLSNIFVTTKKLSSDLESPHFPTFPQMQNGEE